MCFLKVGSHRPWSNDGHGQGRDKQMYVGHLFTICPRASLGVHTALEQRQTNVCGHLFTCAPGQFMVRTAIGHLLWNIHLHSFLPPKQNNPEVHQSAFLVLKPSKNSFSTNVSGQSEVSIVYRSQIGINNIQNLQKTMQMP